MERREESEVISQIMQNLAGYKENFGFTPCQVGAMEGVLSRLDQTWVLIGTPWLLWGGQILLARLVGAASFSLPLAQRNFLGPRWWPQVPARHSPRPEPPLPNLRSVASHMALNHLLGCHPIALFLEIAFH